MLAVSAGLHYAGCVDCLDDTRARGPLRRFTQKKTAPIGNINQLKVSAISEADKLALAGRRPREQRRERARADCDLTQPHRHHSQ